MFERLLRIRYLAVVIVLVASLHAIGFLVMGVAHAIRAYAHIAQGHMGGGEVRPGLEMLQSLDSMLIALVLVVTAAGIAKIFLVADTREEQKLPGWLRLHSFHELEVLIWESILLAMLIAALPLIAEGVTHPEWIMLVLPSCILVLAVSLHFVRRKE